MIPSDMPRTLAETAQEMAQTMQLSTLERMLDFTRIEAGKADPIDRGELETVAKVFGEVRDRRRNATP